MNWENYDRLVRHLKTMDPKKFKYMSAFLLEGAGCVACQILEINGMARLKYGGSEVIQDFLQVSKVEANYLWVPENRPEGDFGEGGVKEALRQLAIVAGKYQRPEAVTEPKPFVGDEQAFLASVRALVREHVPLQQ